MANNLRKKKRNVARQIYLHRCALEKQFREKAIANGMPIRTINRLIEAGKHLK